MWIYEKRTEYPINIKNPNPKMAKLIITQYGGPDGELGASLRYLSQRFSMPCAKTKGILNDVGTSGTKMFQSARVPDKPYVEGLLIHSIRTTDKLNKHGAVENIISGNTERIINLFVA